MDKLLSRRNLLHALYWLLPPLLSLAIYQHGLRAWFQLDDFAWLHLRYEVTDFPSLMKTIFSAKAQGTFRPLSETLYFLTFSKLFGLNSVPYRLVPCVTMLGVLTLLNAVVRRLTASRLAGFLAALIYVVNWNISNVMVWTCIYAELMCGFFLLLAFYFLLRAEETGERRYIAFEWLAFLVGFGALETNVIYPVIACAYAWLFARRHLRHALAMFAVSVVYGLGHIFLIPKAGSGIYGLHFGGKIIATFLAYCREAFIPGTPGLGFIVDERLLILFGKLAIVAVAVFIVWSCVRRNWVPLVLALWAAAPLGPVSLLPDHFSPYYLTVPLLGFSALFAYGVVCAIRASWKWAAIPVVAAAVFIVLSAPAAYDGTRWWYVNGVRAQTLVQLVQRARELHPHSYIFLEHVDDVQFWHVVYHQGFAAAGVVHVYLTENEALRIAPRPGYLPPTSFAMPFEKFAGHVAAGRAVIYRLEGDAMRNITPRLP